MYYGREMWQQGENLNREHPFLRVLIYKRGCDIKKDDIWRLGCTEKDWTRAKNISIILVSNSEHN
jgi:hypothetical protein